jgi:hypothetical protein
MNTAVDSKKSIVYENELIVAHDDHSPLTFLSTKRKER